MDDAEKLVNCVRARSNGASRRERNQRFQKVILWALAFTMVFLHCAVFCWAHVKKLIGAPLAFCFVFASITINQRLEKLNS